jgi:predicted TIM-barrel fold metal-dependent hydrolase
LRPTIDAHCHLWQLGRFPYVWLAPDAPPRPFGDHGALKRDYLLPDYLNDTKDAGIVGAVFVEANSGAPAAAEIGWVEEVARNGRNLPTVAVASVDLRRPDTGDVLAELKRMPRMRGVRMSLCWHEQPRWRFIERPDVMLEHEFRSGLAALTRHDLVFDALVVPRQLPQLAHLARANPEQAIVLNHLGTPWFEGPADRDAWREGIRDCARCPNICVKISGLWSLDRQWRPEIIGEPVGFVVDLFGPERCMWASNLPVEKLMCPVDDQLRSLEHVLDGLAEAEKDMIFRTTAMRVYRMKTGV